MRTLFPLPRHGHAALFPTTPLQLTRKHLLFPCPHSCLFVWCYFSVVKIWLLLSYTWLSVDLKCSRIIPELMDLETAYCEEGSVLMLRRDNCYWLGGRKATATGSVNVSLKVAGEEKESGSGRRSIRYPPSSPFDRVMVSAPI